MSNVLNFAEIDDQHVELLPARTVLSAFKGQLGGGGLPVPDPASVNNQVSFLSTLSNTLSNPLSNFVAGPGQ